MKSARKPPLARKLRKITTTSSTATINGKIEKERRKGGVCHNADFICRNTKGVRTFSLLSLTEKCKHEISAENLFSLPICVIMELIKSLSLGERWRRSRRRGRTIPLSPAIAGALPKGEPWDACYFRGMGFARSICNTNAKLAINKSKEVLYG